MDEELELELELFPEEPNKEPHYSATRIKEYMKCPAAAYASQSKQPSSKGLSLVLGSACHAGLEMFAKEQVDPLLVFREYFRQEADRYQIPKSKDYVDALARGETMVTSGQVIIAGMNAKRAIDPKLVESSFSFRRNGRLYVGKLDLVWFRDEQHYGIWDHKSGKRVPTQFVLKSDVQFNLYAYGSYIDDTLPTFQIWPDLVVWNHLAGKNNPKIPGSRKKEDIQMQYEFPIVPKMIGVERLFNDTIEPVVENLSTWKTDGANRSIWYRNRGEHCQFLCSYYDKVKERCGMVLPGEV